MLRPRFDILLRRADWKAVAEKGLEAKANSGAWEGFGSSRNNLLRASIGQAESFMAARIILTPSWFRSDLLRFRRSWAWL